MPKKSNVWNHFTRLTDSKGNIVSKAKCNNCADNKELDTKAGTTNLWRHFLKHFTRDDQGGGKGTVQCNICQAKLKASAGTSSLVEHVEACIKKGAAAFGASQPLMVQTRAPSGSGSSSMDLDPAGMDAQPLPSTLSCTAGSSDGGPDMAEPTKRLPRMIALNGYDPSIVEDSCFMSFVESLNPEFRVPSRVDIEAVCDVIFDEARSYSYPDHGRISVAVGKATIMEKQVLYTAKHFIDGEWNLHKMIMEVNLDGPSPYHFGKLGEDIRQFCVESHLVEMVRWFSDWMGTSEFDEDDVFMMAWGITKDHSMLKDSINQNFPDTYAVERGLVCTTFMDVILHSVAEHLYLQIDSQFREDMHTYRIGLTRQQREKLLSHVGVDLWAYKESWYSWYCYLLVLCNKYSGAADLKFAELLCKIWGEIYRAIKIISVPKLPTSNLCLLELFKVRTFLESEITLISGGHTNLHKGCTAFMDSKGITTVLTELRDILDKAIQESYLVWSIPLVLDPRYNLVYVKKIFRGAFGEAAGSYISELTKHINMMYSDYVEDQPAEVHEELDRRYLTLPVVHPTEGFDILDWWKVHGSHYYPMLALMAKDALAMPTSSQLSSKQIAHVKGRLRGYSD